MPRNTRMLLFVYALLNFFASTGTREAQNPLRRLSKCSANYTLAGLFPLHKTPYMSLSAEGACNKGYLSTNSIYQALAMIYAVSKINGDHTLLPGITLGVDIADTCGSLDIAIQSYLSLDFVHNIYQTSHSHGWSEMHGLKPGPTVAVIDTGSSTVANSLSTLSNLFDVPLISSLATSPSLGNKNRFKSFFRTVPSDDILAEMIVDLLEKFKWHLVSAIFSTTDYGFTAFTAFQQKLKKASQRKGHAAHLCLGFNAQFATNGTAGEMIFTGDFSKSKVVVIFAHSFEANFIMDYALKQEIKDKVWILIDGTITSQTYCSKKWASFSGKIITVTFKNKHDPRFAEFIVDNIIENENPELIRILPVIKKIRQRFGTVIHDNVTLKIPAKALYVMDAVNAAAHALHIALNCSETRCQTHEFYEQRNLLKSMYKVSFKSQLGHQVSFDQQGEVGGIYTLHVIKNKNDICSFEEIGEWRQFGSEKGFVHLNLTFAEQHKSSCESCPDGWGRLPIEAGYCCWTCKQCTGDEFKSNETELCEKCPLNSIPDSENKQCITLTRRHTSLTDDNLGIAVLCACTTGLVLVVLILIVFYKYRNTHLVRASGKEVTAVLLVGIALGFSTPLFGMIAQNTWTCQLYVYVNGLSFSLMIGSLFTKANRISRIFSKQAMRMGKLKFMTVKWQLFFISIFVALEMAMMAVVVFNSKDKTRSFYVRSDQYMVPYCHMNYQMLIALMSFNGILVLLCTYQAFLSRKYPDEYSESRSIFVVMVLITLQTLACLATLCYGEGNFNPVLISLSDYLDATVITAVLFGFKIYIILFKPDKNRVPNPHGKLGTFLSTKRKRKRTLNTDEQQASKGSSKVANIGIINSSFVGHNDM